MKGRASREPVRRDAAGLFGVVSAALALLVVFDVVTADQATLAEGFVAAVLAYVGVATRELVTPVVGLDAVDDAVLVAEVRGRIRARRADPTRTQ